jgi:hypothetical protein
MGRPSSVIDELFGPSQREEHRRRHQHPEVARLEALARCPPQVAAVSMPL